MVGPPWSVQVELVEGCTRLCPFCGLTGIREKTGGFKYLELGLARRIANECRRFCPGARYEFAMHGEPLVHPDNVEIFRVFRRKLPNAQIQVTTNGGPLMSDMQGKLEEIFSAGVDFVVLDTYYPERDRLRERAGNLEKIEVVDFYDDCVPVGWSPWANHRRKVRNRVILMDDLLARNREVSSRVIYNHAGNAKSEPDAPEPLKKTCTNPFREITFTWDGTVNICCMDWGNEYVCGNIREKSIEEIWLGEEFESARSFLQAKDRKFTPCSRCNKNSGARAGLLPKYGKPTKHDAKVLERVVRSAKTTNGRLTECFVDAHK